MSLNQTSARPIAPRAVSMTMAWPWWGLAAKADVD